MIEVKNGVLVQCTPILQKLVGKELKAKAAWTVAKLIKFAEKEVSDYEEARMKLIDKYGVKNEDGSVKVDEATQQYIIADESKETFNNEHKELAEATVEIPINKLKIGDLGEAGFMPAELLILEPFIDLDEE